MRELTDKQKRAAIRTQKEIFSRCRPLLIGFGGSIAYGLDTPGSDIDIRGIFLNPAEEWIGLRQETEQLRLEDSDTVLYGLRKAMKLLLNGNPNVVELLGLRPEHVLFCSEEGGMILENAPLFLSQKTGLTFGAFAVNLRRQIQKRLEEKKPDRKAIAKEMCHLIRIYAMGGDLLENGLVISFREREHELLAQIRAGAYQDRHGVPTPAYERLLLDYMGAFNGALSRTRLPREPDWERANALTMEIVRRSIAATLG